MVEMITSYSGTTVGAGSIVNQVRFAWISMVSESEIVADLLEHDRNPFHRGQPESFTCTASLTSRQCGDQITLFLLADDNYVQELWHTGQGCLVSQAAASILCQWAEGQQLTNLLNTTEQQFLAHIDPPLTPLRQQCALLPLNCLRNMLQQLLPER